MLDLSINTGSTNNTIINPSVTPKLKFEGKFNYPVITLGSNDSDGGLYSINGGRSWDAADTGAYNTEYTFIGAQGLGSYMNMSPNLNDVCIWSWVASGGGGSVKHLSHDGGRNWTDTYYASSNFEYSHFNKNTNNIYLGGWAGGGQKSDDDGETFSPLGNSSILYDSSDDESYVYGGPTSHGIYYSTNQGGNWTYVADNGGGSGYRIVKCDASGQYVFGYYGNYNINVTFSDDYGLSYSTLTDSYEARLELRRDASCFVYSNVSSGKLYFSTNQGSSWTNINSPFGTSAAQYFRPDYVNNEIYFSCRTSPNIYRVNDSGDDLELLTTLSENPFNFDASQYGRGFVYALDDSGNIGNVYFSRNSQTWEKIRDPNDDHIGRYIMIL